MISQRNRVFSGLIVALAGALSSAAAFAAPVPVKVDLTNLRCMGNYEVAAKDDDQVYLTVTGVAKGAEVSKRIPESGTTVANTKKPPITEKEPVALYEGELADGEFALLTVQLYQGKGDDAAKAFAGQLADAVKGVAERSKKTLTADEAKALAAATLKAQQGVVTKVKESLSREKKTDHFSGLFNILVWNDGGKLVKRLDPVGLTFGEHYGTDEKIYTKIKYTRNNVYFGEGEGENMEWFPKVVEPLSDDKQTVRVKMLETERVPVEGRPIPLRNVTDYLADIQLSAGGKPVEWTLGGEHTHESQIHRWWEWAE